MGGTGTPARSPGRPKEATRRTIAVGFFLAATFGMLVVLSMPVSHLAQLPRRLPRPLQGALSPLEPFLPPFARGGTPRLPARPPSVHPATLGAPSQFALRGKAGPSSGGIPIAPSTAEPPRRQLANPLFFSSGAEARNAAGCHARGNGMRRHPKHWKCHGHRPHRRNPSPRHERGRGFAPRQSHHPARRRHGLHGSRRCG